MNNIVPIRPGAALIERYASRLAPGDDGLSRNQIRRWEYEWHGPRPLTDRSDLIPRQDLEPLIAALYETLVPATPKQMNDILAAIAACWPAAHLRSDGEVMDAHMALLREDLSEFPADILLDTVRQLSRELKFFPSIAELFQMASALRSDRRARLRLAEDHLREHAHRDEVLRKAEERAETERQAHLAGSRGSLCGSTSRPPRRRQRGKRRTGEACWPHASGAAPSMPAKIGRPFALVRPAKPRVMGSKHRRGEEGAAHRDHRAFDTSSERYRSPDISLVRILKIGAGEC